MPNAEQVKNWIEAELVCKHIDVYGPDEVHFQALVVCEQFEDKTLIQRHQLIYKALGENLNQIHALSLKTLTPQEWQQSGSI